MPSPLPSDFLTRCAEALRPLMRTIALREALLAQAYQVAARNLLDRIDTSGSPKEAAWKASQTALEYGCLDDGSQALEALLKVAREEVGEDKKPAIDRLIDEVSTLCSEGRKWETVYLRRFEALLTPLNGGSTRLGRSRALLVGAGAETALMAEAHRLYAAALTDTTAPLPVWIDLSAWHDGRSTLRSLTVAAMKESDARVRRMLGENRLALLLSRLDQLPNVTRRQTIQDFLIDYPQLSVLIAAQDAPGIDLGIERVSVP
jgi:hypothetical protein